MQKTFSEQCGDKPGVNHHGRDENKEGERTKDKVKKLCFWPIAFFKRNKCKSKKEGDEIRQDGLTATKQQCGDNPGVNDHGRDASKEAERTKNKARKLCFWPIIFFKRNKRKCNIEGDEISQDVLTASKQQCGDNPDVDHHGDDQNKESESTKDANEKEDETSSKEELNDDIGDSPQEQENPSDEHDAREEPDMAEEATGKVVVASSKEESNEQIGDAPEEQEPPSDEHDALKEPDGTEDANNQGVVISSEEESNEQIGDAPEEQEPPSDEHDARKEPDGTEDANNQGVVISSEEELNDIGETPQEGEEPSDVHDAPEEPEMAKDENGKDVTSLKEELNDDIGETPQEREEPSDVHDVREEPDRTIDGNEKEDETPSKENTMGGKHSKRSVDISTPSAEKKDDVNEKVEGDKLQNGTFHIEELTTEKEEKPKEEADNIQEEPQNECDTEKKLETINNKKKKKWSFRSLSFSKKDKAKPTMIKEESKPEESLAPSKSSQEDVKQKEDSEESQDNMHPVEKSTTKIKEDEEVENPEELKEESTEPMKEEENVDSNPINQSERKEDPDNVTNNERNDESSVESVKSNDVIEESGIESFRASNEQKIIVEETTYEEESSETKIEKTSVIKTNNISITEISVVKSECSQEMNIKLEDPVTSPHNESLDLNNEEINGAGESLADDDLLENEVSVKENGLPDIKEVKTMQVLGESKVQPSGEDTTTKEE